MPVTTDRNYRQLLSTSLAYRTREIQDLVFNSTPVGQLLRERGNFREYTGPEIRVSLEIAKLDGQWFSGYDKLNNEPKEIINDAVFTPKNIAVGFSLTGTELLANEGRTRIYNLIDRYMRNAENSMKDAWEVSLHGNGTADAGREMIGFGGALPIVTNSGIYGGIDRATNNIWQTTTFNATSSFPTIGNVWDSTTARPMLESAVSQRSKGSTHATVAIMDLASYQPLSASMVAHQRIVKDDGRPGLTLGYRGLEVATPVGNIEVFCATGVGSVMPANTVYALNMDDLEIYYHPDRNMVPLFPGDGAMPINQDAIAQYLVWNGEMVLSNPRFSFRLITA
jgi:hypothetical protein